MRCYQINCCGFDHDIMDCISSHDPRECGNNLGIKVTFFENMGAGQYEKVKEKDDRQPDHVQMSDGEIQVYYL
jgi:hypothetical protein